MFKTWKIKPTENSPLPSASIHLSPSPIHSVSHSSLKTSSDEDRSCNKSRENINITDLDASDVCWVINPILITMKIFGLWPKKGEKLRNRLNIRSSIVFTYLHIYALHNVANLIVNTIKDEGFYIFLDNASVLIRTLSTAISIDIFFVYYDDIIYSLRLINKFPPLFVKYDLRSLRDYANYVTLTSWIFILIQFGISTWIVVTLDTQLFMNQYFYGFQVQHVNVGLMKTIMSLLWILYIFITLTSDICLKAFYVINCLLLGRCAKSFYEMVNDLIKEEKLNGKQVNYVNCLHSNLSELIYRVDENFTTQTFIWFSAIFLNICIKIGMILIGKRSSFMTSSIIDVIYYSMIMVIIALVAADVGYKCNEILPMTYSLAADIKINDLTVLYQLKLLITKVITMKARLTGWRYFIIDRTFIITMIGAILTYSVILMQLMRSN